MKYLAFTLLSAISLSGCMTQNYKLYEGNDLPNNEVATITASYNETHEKLALKELGSSEDFRQPMLEFVNKKGGPNGSGFGMQYAYNNSWNGEYMIKLKPGKHSFIVSPNHMWVGKYRTRKTLEANLEAGHEYFIGQVMYIKGTSSYDWKALLIDKTNNEIIQVK